MSRKKLLNDNNIGSRIKKIRSELKLKGKLFAFNIGISQGYLSDIENNKANANKTLLLAISYVYKVDYYYLISGKGAPFLPVDNLYNIDSTESGVHSPDAKYCDDPHKDLVDMTREILDSDTEYAKSLAANIKSFYDAVITKNKLKDHEDRIEKLEDELSTIGREKEENNTVLKTGG